MNPALHLRQLGQALWLDNITRGLLTSGTLKKYIDDYEIAGLTSNPSIFEAAIHGADFYDEAIRSRTTAGVKGEQLFLELALEDLQNAADLFLPMHQSSQGMDGWVSMEVSPLLVHDAEGTLREARALHERLQRPNAFIKIPGTAEGVKAIEEAIFAGIPVNVTLLFSREQYLAAEEAYLRGVQRRVDAGLDPKVASVASLFVSRWDTAVKDKVPAELKNKLGIAVARHTYAAYRELLASPKWRKLAEAGALPQRLLWASTGTKDPAASDVLYVESLTAPHTINTVPEKTLLAFADHGVVNGSMPPEGGDAERVLKQFGEAGIDVGALAAQLQTEGAEAFSKSWKQLLDVIAEKGKA
ncbi:transaldolase [Pseudoduganella sp. FT25W]|uniref:Transaldolase n=1 Tax=Duganella alba TaxID=2666081 RepID=A0A6L5QFN3_9BURK|nr:transaldolase [Duganella alba]MRX08515.1 transaldolase [Duganella alba]MRX17011.1 transaldolase [Duganella alba]